MSLSINIMCVMVVSVIARAIRLFLARVIRLSQKKITCDPYIGKFLNGLYNTR
jgi:hypothetical protein